MVSLGTPKKYTRKTSPAKHSRNKNMNFLKETLLVRSTNVNAVDDIAMWPFWITASWPHHPSAVRVFDSGGRMEMRPSWTFGRKPSDRGRSLGPKVSNTDDPPWVKKRSEDPHQLKRADREEEIAPRETSSKKFRLSKTEGLSAVAAWAARKEILELIDAGATTKELRELIAVGEESGPSLGKSSSAFARGDLSPRDLRGRSQSGEQGSLESQTSRSTSEKTKSLPEGLSHLDFKRKAWPPSEETPPIPVQDGSEAGSCEADFAEPTTPEDYDDKPDKTVASDDMFLASLSFGKKAAAPTEAVEPVEPTPSTGYIPAKIPVRKNQTEQAMLEKFQDACLKVYEIFLGAGVVLEIIDLISDGKEVDMVKFHWYTEPRVVGTAYRYARVMLRYGDFYAKKYGTFTTNPPITGKACVLEFIEELKREGAGYRTPQAFLYALDWFSVILGFNCEGIRYARAKRMADDYAKGAPPRNPAPYFEVPMLKYLEEVVLDHNRDLGVRLVAGKLRLCCQSAIRHSDLARTPMGKIEWCNFQGSDKVMGLRAKVDRTKSGPRPWICSFLGVSRQNDRWLTEFVRVLVESHGADWKNHEFCGPELDRSGSFSLRQSSIEGDILIIKRLMMEDYESGYPVPLSEESIRALRWHGAKATMPTMMTHFGIHTRVIRHAGAWSKATDAMPDTYLREAQTLVLKAQVEVLTRLRRGEQLGVLEGKSLGSIPKDLSPEDDETPNLREPEGMVQRAMDSESYLRSVLVGRNSPPAADELAMQFKAEEIPAIEETESRSDADRITLEEGLGYLTADEVSSDSDDQSSGDEIAEMFEHFLVVPTGAGKIHKPLLGDDLQTPMCKVKGKAFSKLMADEAMTGNAQLCRRCFGAVLDCSAMCSYLDEVDGKKVRCGRRCVLHCTGDKTMRDLRTHACGFHTGESIGEDI